MHGESVIILGYCSFLLMLLLLIWPQAVESNSTVAAQVSYLDDIFDMVLRIFVIRPLCILLFELLPLLLYVMHLDDALF